MQAVILAAGKGQRLRPYSALRPKPLLPLPGGTLLDYILAQLQRLGIEDVALVVRDLRLWKHIQLPMPVTWLQQKPPFTLIHALATTRHWVREKALVIHGDNLFWGLQQMDLDRVRRTSWGFVFWPSCSEETSGVYWLSRPLFLLAQQWAHLDDLQAFARILQQHRYPWARVELQGRRWNINTPEEYQQAARYMLDEWPRFETLAVWPGRYIRHKRLWIAENARVEKSTLGVYVTIGPEAWVVRSTLDQVLVWPGVHVCDRTLRQAIVAA